MFKKIFLGTATAYCLISCASSTPINLMCDEQQIEIYIDDEYVGRGLVNYTVPKGQDYVNVSCRDNGIEVYSRSLYIKDKKNQLIELTIPKDYRYSSGQSIIKSKIK